MKNTIILLAAFWLAIALTACGGGEKGAGNADLTSEMDSMSYAIGVSFSQSMVDSKIALNGAQVSKGYLDCMNGTSYVNEGNFREITSKVQAEIQKKQMGQPGIPSGMNDDSLSYAVGSTYYLQLQNIGLELNNPAVAQGIEESLRGVPARLDDAQFKSLLDRLSAKAQAAQAEKASAAAAGNKAKGAAFLAEKAQEEGVKSTPSGLHYKVIKEGTGKSPKETDQVSVHYEGRLIDGTIFDSSIQRGEPVDFPLNGVIRGWTEGLQLMKTGAKYQFYIPSDLAYGDQGAGADIGPGETLIFDVVLLEVK